MSFFNLQKQCGTQGKIQKLISGNLETFEETEISMALKKNFIRNFLERWTN